MLCIKNMLVAWNEFLLGYVDACFHEGEISIITGDNGVGKTTFLYQLGLLKPSTGNYLYQNQEIDLSCQKVMNQFRYQNIYILLQELALFDHMKLKDYLDLMNGSSSHYDLPFPLHQKLSHFSLGEKQYILLYGGFLQDKNIYLLDEPTSALDHDMKLKFYDMLNQWKQNGKIIIIISHDQDLISRSDCLYQWEGQHLLLQREQHSQKRTIVSTQKVISQHKLLKTRLYSPIFKHNLVVVLLLSIICLGCGILMRQHINQMNLSLMNGTRQNIIVYSSDKPNLNDKYGQTEPYYIYEYQNLVFINQALPVLSHEKHMRINDEMKVYYQEDSFNYIKDIDPSFIQKQIGYIISFQDTSLYPVIMKQLSAQYSSHEIQSLYLDKRYCLTLQNEKKSIILFYHLSFIMMMIFISFFYNKKTKQDNKNHLLLMHLLGLSTFKRIIFFIIEMFIILIFISLILWKYPFECFLLYIFLVFIYMYLCYQTKRDFSSIYRNEIS